MNNVDMLIPVYANSEDSLAKNIEYNYKKYGFTNFAIAGLSKGWRSKCYPPKEEYIKFAEFFTNVKNRLKEYDIKLGWYMNLSIKSGHSDEFTSPVKEDGSIHPFSSCPLDKNFQKRLSEDVALFSRLAKPDYIVVEDDYSIKAVNGCYCPLHLSEFEKRCGRPYTREALVEIFESKTPESYKLLRQWKDLMRDSLVSLAKAIRKEVDKESPEIPIGTLQSGGVDLDGDSTEAVCRAFAGDKHTPFTRLYGTFYCGVDIKRLPIALFHPLYSKQHLGSDFKCYHETDGYPHTRFFTAGKHLNTMLSVALSYGLNGSVYWIGKTDYDADNGELYFEEPVYADIYQAEKKRLNTVAATAKLCTVKGVGLEYDPFWNTADNSWGQSQPLWLKCLSCFGVSYTTLPSQVSFWDIRQAKYSDHETIMDRLSKGLFLDGEAAKCLTERGYRKYLGVSVGDDVMSDPNMVNDFGTYEVICSGFAPSDRGRLMPGANSWAPSGNGKWMKIDITNPECQVVSNAYNFLDKVLTPGMTRFENELGGKVVVMSLTLSGNGSQALLNYKRQRVIQSLITWCSDEVVYTKEDPNLYVVTNEAKSLNSDFTGMLTVVNMSEDSLNKLTFHLPEKWKNAKIFKILDINGEWADVEYEKTPDGVTVFTNLNHCEPIFILAK